jgi:hypothetical protein
MFVSLLFRNGKEFPTRFFIGFFRRFFLWIILGVKFRFEFGFRGFGFGRK